MKDLALSRLENSAFLDDFTNWTALGDNLNASLLRARGAVLTAYCALSHIGQEVTTEEVQEALWGLAKELDAGGAMLRLFIDAKQEGEQ